MREINDYDTVWESRMECTGDKQVVDSIRYAKTSTIPNAYNKLCFNSESNAMARKSDHLCNVVCNDTCKSFKTMSRSIIDYILVQT